MFFSFLSFFFNPDLHLYFVLIAIEFPIQCVLLIWKCYLAVLLGIAAWQSRPPRPGYKQKAVGDMQDVTDTSDPWNR